MALFQTDSPVLCYSDVEAAKPGDSEPTILLCNKAEVTRAGFDRQNGHPILFSSKLNKAHEHATGRGAVPGPIEKAGARSSSRNPHPEGNVIEIRKEP